MQFRLSQFLYNVHPSPKKPHYSFLMSQKSSCFASAWDLAPCPDSQCLFLYILLMPTKFSCLAATWDLAPCPHFHYLPNDLLHHQAGDRKGKVSNFRWLRDRKIGSGILSSSDLHALSLVCNICVCIDCLEIYLLRQQELHLLHYFHIQV